MLCTGATVLASQSLGAGDKRRVSVVSSVSALLVLLFGLLLSAVLLLFPEPLFRLISVPDTLIAEAAEYTRLVTLCLAVQGAYMLVCAILRSYGMVKEVMAVSAVMNLCNIAGNAVLINGLGATPLEEQYVMFRRVKQTLDEKGIRVFRTYVGEYATSMEMAGASISICKMNDEMKHYMDHPVNTPFICQK